MKVTPHLMITVSFEHGARQFTAWGHVELREGPIRCAHAPRGNMVLDQLRSASGLLYEPIEGTPLHRAALEALAKKANAS
jgi:hypothetical protein